MCQQFLSDCNFPLLLLAIDRDLAEKVRAGDCPCGGRLHAANYRRKPRGVSCSRADFALRLSFCCEKDGCRARSTPPSVRFLGRRVYLSVMVVLVTALRQGPSPTGAAVLHKRFGVERRTIARWQKWWKEIFPASQFWRVARARLLGESSGEPPRTLVDAFRADCSERMSALLRFLSPIGGSARFELQVF